MTAGHATSWFLPGLIFAIVLSGRIFGPGDLYDKDQPKTLAGTADVVLNGNWIWPRDMLLEPATKPPMYNWLDAGVLLLAPRWDEWTFKVPSIVAAVVIAIVIARATQRSLAVSQQAHLTALLAAAIWFATAPVMKQMYLSRPDMVLCAFLFGAWLYGTRAIDPAANHPGRSALGFWMCVAGAALSKGPPAMLAIAYVLFAAKLVHGRWTLARRVIGHWSAVIFVLLVVGWAILAYRERPDVFFTYFWHEGGTRFTTGGPESISKPIYLPAVWFANHFKPWSLFAVVGLLLMGWRNWLRHPLSPAIVWCGLILVVFSLVPGKRADYLLPAYPMAAMLAGYGLVRVFEIVRLPAVAAFALPLLMATYLAHYELTRSPEAKSGDTRHLVAFAHDVRSIVQPGDRLIFLVKAYHPMLSLLRRHAGNRAHAGDLTPGAWVVAPLDSRWNDYYCSSEPLPNVIQTGPKQLEAGRVALYRIGDVGGPAREDLLPLLASQYEWNFPPDRMRVTRDPSRVTRDPPLAAPLDPGASP